MGAWVVYLSLLWFGWGTPASVAQESIHPALVELEALAFTKAPKGPETDALLVYSRGKLIYERYEQGYGPEKRHSLWSVTKSLINPILGLMVSEGRIKLDDSICKYLKPVPEGACLIRVIDLAQHSSGLDWSEDYERSERPKDSAVIAMLYGEGMEDIVRFILGSHPPIAAPGTRWRYSSGDTNLLVAVLKAALGQEDFGNYAEKKLFSPLGMTSFRIERDAKNVWVGSSYGYATARELARFGELFLGNGIFEKKRILSEEWVRQSLVPAPAMKTTKQKRKTGIEADSYGMQWWLNYENKEQGLGRPWPNQPESTFAALGHWGQMLLIDRDKQIIVVRFGNDREGKLSVDQLLSAARKLAETKR